MPLHLRPVFSFDFRTSFSGWAIALTLTLTGTRIEAQSPFRGGIATRIPQSQGLQVTNTGDFNEDGYCDVVFDGGAGLTLGFSDGRGRFEIVRVLEESYGTVGSAVEDLNGDGHLDLVVLNRGALVLLGDGNGGLVPLETRGISGRPSSVATLDWDGDGIRDVALASILGRNRWVFVLLGRGDGRLVYGPSFMVFEGSFPNRARPLRVGAGDTTGDGFDEIVAIVPEGTLIALHRDGEGVRLLRTSVPASDFSLGYAFGDLGGRGELDVVATSEDGSVLPFYGALGPFRRGTPLVGGSPVGSVALGDLNRDGRLDVVSTRRRGRPSRTFLQVFTQTGLEEFTRTQTVPFGTGLASRFAPLLLGDVDGDGWLDAIVEDGENLLTFLNDGEGSLSGVFASSRAYSPSGSPSRVVVADFDDNDGLDLLLSSLDRLSLVLGDGQGGFASPLTRTVLIDPAHAVGGDFNEDGNADIVVADRTLRKFRVILGDGAGGDGGGLVVDSFGERVVVEDLDGDGHSDLVFGTENEVGWLFGDGTGNFGPVCRRSLPGTLSGLLAVDVTRDGIVDLVLPGDPGEVLVGIGGGEFVSRGALPVSSVDPGVATLDLNRDGILDLVVLEAFGSRAVILEGDGSGSFVPALGVDVFDTSSKGSLAAFDLNRDGSDDLVVSGPEDPTQVFFGLTPGEVSEPFLFGPGLVEIQAADVDGDGALDLVGTDEIGAQAKVLFNTTLGRIPCRRGNINGSGRAVDVLFANGSSGEGRERVVEIPVGTPFELRIENPPVPLGPRTPFVIYRLNHASGPGAGTPVPRGVGSLCFSPPFAGGHVDGIANSFPSRLDALLGATQWPQPVNPAPSVLLDLPQGIESPGTLFFQGIVLDGNALHRRAAVTNGVEVRVR